MLYVEPFIVCCMYLGLIFSLFKICLMYIIVCRCILDLSFLYLRHVSCILSCVGVSLYVDVSWTYLFFLGDLVIPPHP